MTTSQQLPASNVNRWFPSTYDRGPNLLVWVALIACFLTIFIKLWTPTSLNRWPEAIATLLFLYPLSKNWQFLKRQPLLQLMGLAIVCPFLFFAINYLSDAESATKYAKFETLARIYLFVPVAWWLGANLRTIAIFLTVAFAGFMYACLQDPNFIGSIQRIIAGGRVDFGILNAQHVALFFSISLIGLICFMPRVLMQSNTALKILLSTLLTLAFLLCLMGLYGTQTRAAYLALVAALAFFVLQFLFKTFKSQTTNFTKLSFLFVGVVLIIGVLGSITLKTQIGQGIENRLKSENTTLEAIVTRDWQNIPYSSLGIRVNTWILAFNKIKEKPLIGYGAKARSDIIRNSSLPEHIKQNFGHFHNSYIEFTLGYGLLGLVLALGPFIIILVYTKKATTPVKNFTIYSLIVFSFMNLFESYLFFWMGPFLCLVMCAPIISQHFGQLIPPLTTKDTQHAS